jgi:hypothetical protein
MMKFKYILSAVIFSFFFFGCDFIITPEGGDDTGVEQGPSPDPEQDPEQNPDQEPETIPDPQETGRFNIIAWSDITNDGDPSDCEWKLQKLVEADFNMYLGWFDTAEKVEFVLSTADKVGIDIITSSPELESDTQTMVKKMSAHKSLYGYHIMDEPSERHFPGLANRINNIRKYDPVRPCYVNLYPNWAWGGQNYYLALVRNFVQQVPVSFLSFDNYPIKTVNGVSTVRHDWYRNLEDIRTVAVENDLPIWAFALALSHSTDEASYPIPTIGELRLQQFSNMLYGAVAFQYFTTWGFIQNHGVTSVYKNIQMVNSELRAFQKYFYGADIKGIWHTGKSIPSGTKELKALPTGITKLETEDSGALVTHFTKEDRDYIAVVNKNPNGGMDLFISFSDTNAVLVGKDGTKTPVEDKYRIPAGDIRLFTWK